MTTLTTAAIEVLGALVADLREAVADWRAAATAELEAAGDLHDGSPHMPADAAKAQQRGMLLGENADELARIIHRHAGAEIEVSVPVEPEPWDATQELPEVIWDEAAETTDRHVPSVRGDVCAADGETWPCVEVKRIAFELMAQQRAAEAEPEPDYLDTTTIVLDVPEEHARDAMARHLRDKHGDPAGANTDTDVWGLLRVHDRKPHGRRPGLHLVTDHDDVHAYALEQAKKAQRDQRQRTPREVSAR